jgi:deazaflavin-dependent oxidoreductase (nitroreductase family)
MSMPLTSVQPRGLLRWSLRLPLWLYRWHLGWLLGERFLMLTHVGRNSGRLQHTVIEVVRHNQLTDTYFIISDWGEKSDWYQNLQETPEATIQIGRRERAVTATRAPVTVATLVLLTYAFRHPATFRELSRGMVGRPLTILPEDCRLLAEAVPVVALRVGETAA